jgi:SpoVK/Ycf46/Vps4 family AAA+-type ATPase
MVTAADVQTASRTLNRQVLETLATPLDPLLHAAAPVLTPAAGAELEFLLARCRHREEILGAVGAAFQGNLNRGVRALFSGPSGTGKTLAARYLAARLRLDVYRLDLAAVVNKYIGETERNLDQVLSRAEELDVVLLLDEGDALMARRTDVSNSNDRYANLETNFLLQRLETFEGIVIITTNTSNSIDTAFLRRLDATIDFVPPDASQRWQIWQAHLPAGHEVSEALLEEIARRCVLTGGRIRNATLHATLRALERRSPVADVDMVEALALEYKRMGASSPLS